MTDLKELYAVEVEFNQTGGSGRGEAKYAGMRITEICNSLGRKISEMVGRDVEVYSCISIALDKAA